MSAKLKIYRVIRLSAAVWLLAWAWACTKDPLAAPEPEPEPAGGLRLFTGSSVTRSDGHDTIEGETYADDRAEEAIRRVDLFFFENTDSKEAPFYTHELKEVGEYTSVNLTVKVPIEKLDKFKGDQVYVYALVNLPDNLAVDADQNKINGQPATLDNLKSVWVTEKGFAAVDVPGSFVMRGGEKVTLEQSEGKLALVSGTILLERLASKIRLWTEIPDEIYLDENGKTLYRFEDEDENDWMERRKEAKETWKSVPYTTGQDGVKTSNLKLYLINLASRGRIDAYTGSYEERDNGILEYMNVGRGKDDNPAAARLLTEEAQDRLSAADQDEKYTYTHEKAYYSYPNEWNSATPAEQHQTYVILSMPWERTDEHNNTFYQVCYYQIPVNALIDGRDKAKADRLDPNRYYRIKIRLGMLGSKDLGSPLEIDASCEVVEWKNADVDASIKDRRYLVVNQTNWTMNNVHTLEIPFSSSHNAKVVSCYVTYFRYNDVWGTAADTQGEPELQEFTLWLDAADEQLKKEGAGDENSGKNAKEGLVTASFERQLGNPVTSRPVVTGSGYEWVGWLRRRWETREITRTINMLVYEDEDLYYKKEYFYDDVTGSFLYYLGHEHPKTFQEKYITNDKTLNPKVEKMTTEEQSAWAQYNQKYDNINAVYTCTIDNKKGVIRFTHPLVRWKDVRTERANAGTDYFEDVDEDIGLQRVTTTTKTTINKTSSEMEYYVPDLNPRTGYLRDEFSRCEIVIKIRHEDWESEDGLYEETVYITQYPAMYVEVSHDYGGVYKSSSSRGNEYIRVNGHTTEYEGNYSNQHQDGDHYGTATEWFEVTSRVKYFGLVNNNPNMYVIHTTQFSEENEALYELGDPRTLFYNNDLSDASFPIKNDTGRPAGNNWSGIRIAETLSNQDWQYDRYNEPIADGERLVPNGTDKKLSFYYPTDETPEGEAGTKANFVAPSFRIASSLGKVGLAFSPVGENGKDWPELDKASRTEARRRCAAYQEGGRPAGRWRVPTAAEIKYIVQLSADEKIPHLFGQQNTPEMYIPYWSSTGIVCVKIDGAEVTMKDISELETNPAVRCVYDEWYWNQIDKEIEYTPRAKDQTFRWGDRKKDNTQTKALMRGLINKKAVVSEHE